jgi:NADH-quinone oxidoreductase subunit N
VALRPHVVLDGFSRLLQGAARLAARRGVWMSLGSREVAGAERGRVLRALSLSSGLGMFLMASAANLLMAYLSLEFVSLTSYVLTGFRGTTALGRGGAQVPHLRRRARRAR